MLLQDENSGKLVEVLALSDLFSPHHPTVVARMHYGEEPQDPAHFEKSALRFPSGEALPRAWTDPHYRDADVHAAQHHGER